jgi:hypothetical protein
MIRSIEITNFRGIQSGKLENLTPLTILVGPNGCGKSTILDALLLGAHPIPSKATEQLVTERNGLDGEVRWFFWRAELRPAIIKVITDKHTGERTIGLIPQSTEPKLKVDIVRMGSDTPNTPISSFSDSGTGGSHEVYPLPGVSDIRLVESNKKPQGLLVDLFTESLNQGRREEARGVLGDVLTGVVNIEIGTYQGAPRLQVVYPDRSVPVALAGDGVQWLARLSLELVSSAGGVVLLEEPEVHLYPRAILQTAKAIWAAVRRDIQVILSTHSLELIDALLSVLNSEEEQSKLSVQALQLTDGCLKSYPLNGKEAAFERFQIEDDLR